MAPMSLREAAERTSRSITTLRRYIRSGRLHAELRDGRYGPEYYVSEENLAEAGLHPMSQDDEFQEEASPETALATTATSALGQVLQESVPLRLFQELQMKHEQLLVQYGMVRAGGLRLLELQANLESASRDLDAANAEIARLRQRLAETPLRLTRRLREAELELESKRLEIAALKEKMRALEMLTRNSVTNETIEKQFSEVMKQVRRVGRMSAEQPPSAPGWAPPDGGPSDH